MYTHCTYTSYRYYTLCTLHWSLYMVHLGKKSLSHPGRQCTGLPIGGLWVSQMREGQYPSEDSWMLGRRFSDPSQRICLLPKDSIFNLNIHFWSLPAACLFRNTENYCSTFFKEKKSNFSVCVCLCVWCGVIQWYICLWCACMCVCDVVWWYICLWCACVWCGSVYVCGVRYGGVCLWCTCVWCGVV